jgi:hypothetical protein
MLHQPNGNIKMTKVRSLPGDTSMLNSTDNRRRAQKLAIRVMSELPVVVGKMIIGDFNCPPGASRSIYKEIVRNRVEETFQTEPFNEFLSLLQLNYMCVEFHAKAFIQPMKLYFGLTTSENLIARIAEANHVNNAVVDRLEPFSGPNIIEYVFDVIDPDERSRSAFAKHVRRMNRRNVVIIPAKSFDLIGPDADFVNQQLKGMEISVEPAGNYWGYLLPGNTYAEHAKHGWKLRTALHFTFHSPSHGRAECQIALGSQCGAIERTALHAISMYLLDYIFAIDQAVLGKTMTESFEPALVLTHDLRRLLNGQINCGRTYENCISGRPRRLLQVVGRYRKLSACNCRKN